MIVHIGASVRRRLLNHARTHGEEFQSTLTRFGCERFLYRLGQWDSEQRFVLKGATLMQAWAGDTYRPTRDLDFLGAAAHDRDAILGAVEAICHVPCPEDGLEFDLSTLEVRETRASEYLRGYRVRLFATLDGAKIPLQIDVGIGDTIIPGPIDLTCPAILDHLPAPHVAAYPPETYVAEKCEAIVQLAEDSSRMKDFYDVGAIAQVLAFDGRSLQRAVVGTFGRRRTPTDGPIPTPLTTDFYAASRFEAQWSRFQRRMVSWGGSAPTAVEIGGAVIRFLEPVWRHVASGEEFNASWSPGGPWEPSPLAPDGN